MTTQPKRSRKANPALAAARDAMIRAVRDCIVDDSQKTVIEEINVNYNNFIVRGG